MSSIGSSVITVAIHQPALPLYRIPVFRELARRRGISVRVIYGSEADLTNAIPDGFVGIPSRSRRLLGRLVLDPGQLRTVLDRQPDVVVLSWNVRLLLLLPALLIARLRRVGAVLWGHGYSKHETPVALWLRRAVTKLATAVLFYNRREAASYAQSIGKAERVFVAANTLDTDPMDQASKSWISRPGDLEAFRLKNALSENCVLFVSRLLNANRVDILVEAAAALRYAVRNLCVVVIGDGPARQELERHSRQLGLDATVRFVGAIYDEVKLAPWFLTAQVFCYPACIGLSLVHAFAYGVPVVTSDDVQARNPEFEALRPGENGLLYRHADPQDLAEKLLLVLRDVDLRSRMRVNCLRTAREEYTLARMVDGLEAAIRYAHVHGRLNRRGKADFPSHA